MRALQIDAYGLDNLKVVERPDPEPGPGEVRLRLRAVSLNYRDLLMLQGSYGGRPNFPLTPFSDGCGIVDAVGEGVSRVKVGDRVATLFFQGWLSGPPTPAKLATALGQPLTGCGRELAVYSQEGVCKVPDHLSDEEVATLPCAALTAWRAMFEDGALRPGDTALMQGTGGVSVFGLQFAKAAGLRTVITSSSDAKLERARALGADHVVNYRATPEWARPAREATGGRGVDFVMEVGGAKTLHESLRAIRTGGHIAIIGVLSGPQEPLSMPVMIATAARVQGVSVGSREMFEAMCRAIALHRIQPVVDRTYPFTEARAALQAMAAGEHFGKIVLTF